MTGPAQRPLSNLAIAISISEAERPVLEGLGLTPADINHVTVELCRRLVALGAQVVLGHQWRPGGVMDAVARFAKAYQEATEPILQNFLAWPDRAALSESDRKRLESVVRIHEFTEPQPDRPMALHEMRQRMADVTSARICLCGKLQQPEGFVPGLIEEAALTLARGKPVYASRMMGGTSALLADFFSGEAREPLLKLSKHPKFKGQLRVLRDFDASRLAETCGLTHSELRELFDAQNVDTIVHLTTLGLTRLHRTSGR
jgi:hypothetical protein